MVSQFSKSVPVAPITVRVDSSGVHCVLTQKSYVIVQKDGSLVWSVGSITVRVDSGGVHRVVTKIMYVIVRKDGSLVWSVGSAKASLWLLSRCVWTVVVCIV